MAHRYTLGNVLRKYFTGFFEDDLTAWETLGRRFDESYPSHTGRYVQMTKTLTGEESSELPFSISAITYTGKTKGGNETDHDRLIREELQRILAEERKADN